ncbi:hypothetical protein [Cryptosporangium phraense]|uniref:Uncharacterized protein n=1 Tax=Cryptosporangium phraense TaxID=2593070 RepID=A0A545AGE3_9ACTN|nr:hypothetical protein [Cryptosporangium phraense]TQS40407.1 hypothetical protein FL583_34760 [Cryptosporangium phraense]
MPTGTDRGRAHALLLGLAGRVPDDGLAMMRTFLADEDDYELAHFLTMAVESGRLALTGSEQALVTELVADHGFLVAPLGPELRADEIPVPTARFSAGDDGDGTAEQVAIEAAGRLDGVRALWRSWRTTSGPVVETFDRFSEAPADDRDPTRPVRVFLVEATADADLPELTAELQQWLAEIGEDPPRVEVFGPGPDLPPYQEAALAGSTLLWTDEPPAETRLARAFDGADAATGPFFHPDHPQVDAAERDALLAYLTGAEAVLLTPGTMVDVVAPDRGAVVPMSFRSDGVWIWPDTVAYYLREHGLAPEPDLAEHIKGADEAPKPLTRLSHHRVMATLAGPPPEPPAWRAD